MIYIIGLGLNEKGISLEGIEAIKNSKKVYLENYTVDFPYDVKHLEKTIGKKIIPVGRIDVESDFLIKEAKKENICLLVYGSPLFATTHYSLLIEAKKQKVKTKIIYSASVFDAIAETGLQLYKFGKITSIPKWQNNFKPDSFLDYVIENQKIRTHSLILIDIGIEFKDAIRELEEASERKNINIKQKEIIVCSNLGTSKSKIYFGNLETLRKLNIKPPYCLIIPSEMHFFEKECVERFRV